MKIKLERNDYYQNKNSWFCILPSLGVGYCRGLFCVSLYLFVWEFLITFEWEEEADEVAAKLDD